MKGLRGKLQTEEYGEPEFLTGAPAGPHPPPGPAAGALVPAADDGAPQHTSITDGADTQTDADYPKARVRSHKLGFYTSYRTTCHVTT